MLAAGLALALSLPASAETSDPSPVELALAADGSLDVVARWADPLLPRTRGRGASAHVHGGSEGSARAVPNDTFRTILPEPGRAVAVGDVWAVDRSGVETIVRHLHPGADVSPPFALLLATNDRHSEVVFRADVTPPPADGGADRDAPAAAPFVGLLRIDRERGAVVRFRLGPMAKPFAPAPRNPASRGATAATEPPATRELVGGAFDHDVVWTEEVTFEAAARALERAARPTERTSGGPRADDVLAAIDAALAQARADGTLDPSTPGWRLRMPPPPDVAFAADAALLWRLDTTKGTLVVRLRPDVAPKHVTSTIHLTRAGFYDGLSFHRVLGGFMAQGGCPLGTGTGDPGWFVEEERGDTLLHDRRGVVSAANAGEGTDGSQWFVTFAPAPTLDGLFTIFGEVVDGEETLAAIERCAQSREQMQRTYCEAPLDPITIRTATVGIEGE